MNTSSNLLFSCLFCFALSLLSGCSDGLSPEERAEVNKYLTAHNRDLLAHYLHDVRENTDEKLILKHCKYLVSKGVNVNADNYGFPPLYSAAAAGHIEVVKFLVSKGADVNIKHSIRSDAPLDVAMRNGHTAIVEYLSPLDKELYRRQCSNNIQCIMYALHTYARRLSALDFVENADKALYIAKKTRNCVAVYR